MLKKMKPKKQTLKTSKPKVLDFDNISDDVLKELSNPHVKAPRGRRMFPHIENIIINDETSKMDVDKAMNSLNKTFHDLNDELLKSENDKE
jgi:adenine specific DNA methylase Mod